LTEALAAAVNRLVDQLEHERARADDAVTRAADLREAIAVLEARLAGSEGALAEARAHAERAETSRDADRARAEALRQMLDEAEAAEKRARARAETAEDHVEALRQTEEARRGRGRLARLRAAWRGE
jgi:chromosome segregation ATPase